MSRNFHLLALGFLSSLISSDLASACRCSMYRASSACGVYRGSCYSGLSYSGYNCGPAYVRGAGGPGYCGWGRCDVLSYPCGPVVTCDRAWHGTQWHERIEPAPMHDVPSVTPEPGLDAAPIPAPVEEPLQEPVGPAAPLPEAAPEQPVAPVPELPATPAPEQPNAEPSPRDEEEEAADAPLEGDETPEIMQPAPEQPPSEKPDDELDDLFKETTQKAAHTTLAAWLASLKPRDWQDNTGRYSCQGRLVQIMPNTVRILKQNGRISTVPLARLSQQDRLFVRAQSDAAMDVRPVCSSFKKYAGRKVRARTDSGATAFSAVNNRG